MKPREPTRETISSASAIADAAARKRAARISATLLVSSAIGNVVSVRVRRPKSTQDRVTASSAPSSRRATAALTARRCNTLARSCAFGVTMLPVSSTCCRSPASALRSIGAEAA
jgi:hypothetical protein